MKIKLPYLASYRSDGKTYYYVRRKRHPNVRVDGIPGTAEFMASYQAALVSSPAKGRRHGPGTFGLLCSISIVRSSSQTSNRRPSGYTAECSIRWQKSTATGQQLRCRQRRPRR